MHKKYRILFIVMIALMTMCLALSGCSAGSSLDKRIDDLRNKNKPDVNKIRNICELATLECEYRNVAKSTKAPESGILHIGEKTRKFWVEYRGKVEISFDVSKIEMEQDDTNIHVTLPEPKLTCSVAQDSSDDRKYIIEPDQFLQKNPITADDQTQAIKSAQESMREQVVNNSSLIQTAERQAEELIENYIKQIGELTNTEYHVTFDTTTLTERSNGSISANAG